MGPRAPNVRHNQSLLDDFGAGFLIDTRDTETLPLPGSIVQRSLSPASNPSNAATGSGTVTRMEAERFNGLNAVDSNTLDISGPREEKTVGDKEYGLDVSLAVGDTDSQQPARMSPLPSPSMQANLSACHSRHLRLDDRALVGLGGSAKTVTRPALRSTVQTSMPPGSASNALATPSGIVVRTEADPGCVSWIEDRNVPGKAPPR